MNTRTQKLFMWSELLVILLIGGGVFGVAGFFPPHEPARSAAEIAQIYQAEPTRIRAGLMMAVVGVIGVLCFAAVISEQMKRMKGVSPMLERCQFGAGGLAQAIFASIVWILWLTASYRPERDPEITQVLNDMGWIIIVGLFTFAFIQNVTIAWAVFADARERPVFPRWVAYLNVWVAASYLLSVFVIFFKTGPFAWNGLLAFYVPFPVFGVWIFAMIAALRTAIRQQEEEQGRGEATPARLDAWSVRA
ncbi:MAG TPA: hypothetical protein VJM11_06760 [Nevskiaceae bacterium]|nr:hypothetical protein [Nevskiaceae bacterium]